MNPESMPWKNSTLAARPPSPLQRAKDGSPGRKPGGKKSQTETQPPQGAKEPCTTTGANRPKAHP